jgi:hypothetical protein
VCESVSLPLETPLGLPGDTISVTWLMFLAFLLVQYLGHTLGEREKFLAIKSSLFRLVYWCTVDGSVGIVVPSEG